MGFAVLLTLVALVAIGLGLISYQVATARREQLSAYARQRGWTWRESDDFWVDAFEGEPFGVGHGRRTLNVLTGTYDGRPLVAFDYRYTTTSTTSVGGRLQNRSVQHPFSVVAVDSGAHFPPLSVTPESFVGRALGRLTGADIELESEDFNRAFTVLCPDRKFASDVLHPRMLELLLRRPDLGWRLERGWLLVHHEGSHTPAEIDAVLQVIDEIVDQVPDFVWRAVLGDVPPAQPGHRRDGSGDALPSSP